MAKKKSPQVIDREIRKIGTFKDSLYTTIPSSYAKKLNLNKGDFCNLFLLDDDTIIIKKSEE